MSSLLALVAMSICLYEFQAVLKEKFDLLEVPTIMKVV